MTFDDMVQLLWKHAAGLFPRTCTNCGREYKTLAEYIRSTEPVGRAMSHDAHVGDFKPTNPLGALSLSNCACGNTLSLSSEGMPLETQHQALAWLKSETERRGVRPDVISGELREEVRRRVMAERQPHAPAFRTPRLAT